MRFQKLLVSATFALVMLQSTTAVALPFNDDMVDNPMKTGRVMRPLPPDSLSEGAGIEHLAAREDALKLTNPIKGDKVSTLNGKRLFAVNCSPCHGDISTSPHKNGTVTQYLPGPDLSTDIYRDK